MLAARLSAFWMRYHMLASRRLVSLKPSFKAMTPARRTYQMRTILDDVRVNGKTLFLTSREPTLEPAENLPSNEIKKYCQRKRCKVERVYVEVEASEDKQHLHKHLILQHQSLDHPCLP
ncbi:hypothetical protein PHMEG_00028673 [Phytophthora megakarya]|uniref:Uncharacterized protein n=1 Tax=Phytophthora megakarya TaxID=4795 RepID=A0A225V2L6_9STRA|nr:hypothetical protein PHMEG_00028673 [Phytophthora megakarya]